MPYPQSGTERKKRLALRARKGDSNYLHAQLILAGQTVLRDEIVGSTHVYYFDCGCIRTYSRESFSKEEERLDACKKHKKLQNGVRGR